MRAKQLTYQGHEEVKELQKDGERGKAKLLSQRCLLAEFNWHLNENYHLFIMV